MLTEAPEKQNIVKTANGVKQPNAKVLSREELKRAAGQSNKATDVLVNVILDLASRVEKLEAKPCNCGN